MKTLGTATGWIRQLPEVRKLVEGRPNAYFRGLVSQKLGSERRLDDNDELFDLVLQSPLLQQIYHDIFNTELGRARLARAVKKWSASGVGFRPNPEDLCKLAWDLAIKDPRFDVLLKQAIEDSKAPPQAVRGSGLSRISAVLEKIRSALASGAARHSNAVLAGSVVAGLLAGSAATKVIPPLLNSGPTTTARVDNAGVVAAIGGVTAELKRQTGALTGMQASLEKLDAIDERLEDIRNSLASIGANQVTNTTKLRVEIDGLQELITNIHCNSCASPEIVALLNDIDQRTIKIQTAINTCATPCQLGPQIDGLSGQLRRIADALRQDPSPGKTGSSSTVVSNLEQLNRAMAAVNATALRGSVNALDLGNRTLLKNQRTTIEVPLSFQPRTSCLLDIMLKDVDKDEATFELIPDQTSQAKQTDAKDQAPPPPCDVVHRDVTVGLMMTPVRLVEITLSDKTTKSSLEIRLRKVNYHVWQYLSAEVSIYAETLP